MSRAHVRQDPTGRLRHVLEHRSGRELEPSGDAQEGRDPRIGHATLYATDYDGVDPCSLGDHLLRQASLLAESCDRAAEGFVRRVHGRRIVDFLDWFV